MSDEKEIFQGKCPYCIKEKEIARLLVFKRNLGISLGFSLILCACFLFLVFGLSLPFKNPWIIGIACATIFLFTISLLCLVSLRVLLLPAKIYWFHDKENEEHFDAIQPKWVQELNGGKGAWLWRSSKNEKDEKLPPEERIIPGQVACIPLWGFWRKPFFSLSSDSLRRTFSISFWKIKKLIPCHNTQTRWLHVVLFSEFNLTGATQSEKITVERNTTDSWELLTNCSPGTLFDRAARYPDIEDKHARLFQENNGLKLKLAQAQAERDFLGVVITRIIATILKWKGSSKSKVGAEAKMMAELALAELPDDLVSLWANTKAPKTATPGSPSVKVFTAHMQLWEKALARAQDAKKKNKPAVELPNSFEY